MSGLRRGTLSLLVVFLGCARGIEPEKSSLEGNGSVPGDDGGSPGGGGNGGQNSPALRDAAAGEGADGNLSIPPSPGIDASVDGATPGDAGTGPSACDDQNPCTIDLNTPLGCTHLPTNGSCDDGLSCTNGDRCTGGACQGTDTCTNGTRCLATLQACGQCATDSDCNDQKPCTRDTCNVGQCEHAALTGPACDDGIACTANDACVAGACEGAPQEAACDDQNPCTDDTCAARTGCTHQEHTRACDDGVSCTSADTCAAGICEGTDSCGTNQACDRAIKLCRARLLKLYFAATTSFGPTSANAYSIGDVAEVDTDTLLSGSARWVGERKFFDHTSLGGDQGVDGFSREPTQGILLSTTGDSSLGGLSFNRADIVRILSGTATRVFNGRALLDCAGGGCDERDLDVDAVHALEGGDILFSMTSDFKVSASGQTFGRGSIMRLTPRNNQIVELVSDTFFENIDVDGIAVHPFTGHFLLSTSLSSSSFGGGFSFDDEDVIELAFGPGQAPIRGYSYFIDGTVDVADHGSDITAIDLR